MLIWKPLWRPLMLAGRGRAARRDRALPGNVDIRLDHAGRLCLVFAQRGGPAAGRAVDANSSDGSRLLFEATKQRAALVASTGAGLTRSSPSPQPMESLTDARLA